MTPAPDTVNEGNSSTITVDATDPAGPDDPLLYSFDCDNNPVTGPDGFEVGPQIGNSGDCSFPDDSDHVVNVKVDDQDGGVTTGSTTVTVNNVAPTINSVVPFPATIDENESSNIRVVATDPAGLNDPLLYSFDCDNDNVFEVLPQSGDNTDCDFLDDSDHPVNVKVDDQDGGVTIGSATVIVNNVAPTINSIDPDPPIIDEGQTSTITVTASDQGPNDVLLYSIDCNGDGDFDDPSSGDIKDDAFDTFAICKFPDDSIHKVNVKVDDQDGGITNGFTIVTVNNVPPTIVNVTGDRTRLPSAGGDVVVTVTAVDDGVLDVLSYSYDCDGDDIFELGPQAGNVVATCTLAGGSPPVRKINVKVDDGDGGEDTDSITILVGAAVDLAVLPADSTPAEGAPFPLALHVTADTPISRLDVVIKFGWRIQIDTGDITPGPNNKMNAPVCNVIPPVGTTDGTIICSATTGDKGVTGDFDVAIFTFTAANIGRADVNFAPVPDTDAKLGGATVLRDTFDAQVKVEGLVDVEIKVDLQAPAPNDTETFQVKFYASGDFPTSTADQPWLIFNQAPVRTIDLVVAADDFGGTEFTLVLTGANQIDTDVYVITIGTKRSGDLRDTLVNLKDDVDIDRPPIDLEGQLTIDMGVLLEGNAIDGPGDLSPVINARDASVLVAAFGTSTAVLSAVVDGDTKNFDARVDLDRDGDVDQDDLDILIGNFLRFSPVILN